VVSGVALGVGHVSCVLKRSVLLSIRAVSSIVLLGLREGFTMPYENPTWYEQLEEAEFLFRAA